MKSPQRPFRLLITSLAAKVPLLTMLRNTFAKAGIPLFICGADADPDCIGRHFVDNFWVMPKIAEIAADEVIDFCKKHELQAIIPTRDGELCFFAQHRERFHAAGIFVMVASPEGVALCYDKLAFYHAAQSLCIQTTQTLADLSSPAVVVKERYGSGSRNNLLNTSRPLAKNHASRLQNPIFQPWIEGSEYSIDLYLTQKGKKLGAIVRSRDLIANGEAQISTTVQNPTLMNTCTELAVQLKLSGHLVIQAIIDSFQRIHIIECNCRFGGASTLSVTAGLNSPLWLYCEALDIAPDNFPFSPSTVTLRQIRHTADRIIEMEESQ